MLACELVEIETVELVARKDKHEVLVLEIVVVEVLADRVGRTLIPSLLVARLLGGENVDEATAETVELISLLDVLMERRRIELRQDENLVEAGVEAVADRDVDQAVVTGEGDGWLAPVLSQGIEAGATTAPHDNADDAREGRHGERPTFPPVAPALKRKRANGGLKAAP